MRYMVRIEIPNDKFNECVRDGSAGQKIGNILEETKPEHIWFTEMNGHRGAMAIYNMDKESQVPSIAEPWFMTFNANCHFQVAMAPADLKNAGLDDLGKKWK